MTKLSLGDAWNEAAEFVKREARLLFPIAFVFSALPTAALSALTPDPGASQGPPPTWVAALLFVLLLSLMGQVAISYLVLRRNSSVGEALGGGFGRLLPLVGAVLAVAVALALVAVPLALLAVAFVPGLGSEPPDPEAVRQAAVLLTLLLAPLMLFTGARMLVLAPAAAAEPAGPLALIRRSWALTRGRVWMLIAFILLVFILIAVINIVLSKVVGTLVTLAAGPIEPGTLPSFIMLLIGAAVQTVETVYLNTIVARIYAQLADEAPASGI